MQYISHYLSPLGNILLAGDDAGLTGLWFEGQKYFARSLDGAQIPKELPLFQSAAEWLDVYFSGRGEDRAETCAGFGKDGGKTVLKIRGQVYSVWRSQDLYGELLEIIDAE